MLKSLMKTALVIVAFAAPTYGADDSALDTILASSGRSDAEKTRDQYRHPKAVMELFEIGPGMTITDALPGSWYGKILAPLIGETGTYYGTRYSAEHAAAIWGADSKAAQPGYAAEFKAKFTVDAAGWASNPPKADTFMLLDAPESAYGTIDRYLLIRAAHHINRRGPEFLDQAAEEAFKLVKSGGIAGIVQHRAPEDNSDEWAAGKNGYVKQSRVIDAFTKAGFVLEVASDVNANPKDQPTEDDRVWRLPPVGDATDIGESDRMTLKFRRP